MSKTAIDELNELLSVLKIEKEEELEFYRKQIQNKPIADRKKEGYCWYPLQVIQTGFAIGDRAYIVVERHQDKDNAHQFRSGTTVNFFTQQTGVEDPTESGIINYIDKNRMKIILHSKDIPDWINGGMIGVDLVFDDRSYMEMEKAIKKTMDAEKNRLAELRDKILGYKKLDLPYDTFHANIASLNTNQNKAIQYMLSAPDVAIVHGPPGTGKTTTLVQAIRLLCQKENTVLVTAPSNTATDLLTERLTDQGLNVVRIGHISRVDEKVLSRTLDYQISHHPDSKSIKKVKQQAAAARQKARKYKRSFGYEERQERDALYKEARELSDWANQLEDRLLDQIITSADVIACTLVGVAHPILNKYTFKTVVIDEAAQALEPACWIAISKASKVIMTGDPLQLPPTVKSYEAQKKGLNITLMEKCLNRLHTSQLLNVQYRMHHAIMDFSNLQFYNGQLLAAEEVKYHQLEITDNQPVIYIDTAGCGFDEQSDKEQKSKMNPDEYGILREHLYQLTAAYNALELPSIAIISPYREQVNYILEAIREDEKLADKNIEVNSIDGFQGQEMDVVYISLVRSNTKNEIGFLQDYRRMNVAMTRARKQLIVVGDSATIGNNNFYASFLSYCEAKGAYRSAWEYMQL